MRKVNVTLWRESTASYVTFAILVKNPADQPGTLLALTEYAREYFPGWIVTDYTAAECTN
jgi:hypothetical protein